MLRRSTILAAVCCIVPASAPWALAQSQGPNAPAVVVNDATLGVQTWTTTPPHVALLSAANNQTQYLLGTEFGFTVPQSATVLGIEVSLTRGAVPVDGAVQDLAVRIVKAGAIGATDRSVGGVDWPLAPAAQGYGGGTDLWGETWTPSDVNASNFGIAIAAKYTGTLTAVATITNVTVTIHYFDCTPAPEPSCVTGFEKAQLAISEAAVGGEKLQLKMLKGPVLAQGDFGNPFAPDGTDYRVCIYDDANVLAGVVRITRGGDLCVGKPCWSGIGGLPPNGKGWKYKDQALAADGVQKIIIGANGTKPAKLILKARNKFSTQPLGITAALEGSTSVTMQFVPEDGSTCVSATLTEVTANLPTIFKAK